VARPATERGETMRSKAWIFVVGLVALGLLTAGCGGGDDDNGDEGADGGEALTEEEYVAQANEICGQGQEEADEISARLQEQAQDDPDQFDDAVAQAKDELLPVLRDTFNRLGELRPPEELREPHDRLNAAADEAIDGLEEDPNAFEADPEQVETITSAVQELGITECADTAGGGGQSTTP
jgi:hypothetical protein